MLNQNLLLADDGYNIQRSLRFRSSVSAYLSRTPASAGNRQKWTWSGWVKRGSLSSGSYMDLFTALSGANDFTEVRYHFNTNDDTLVFTDIVSGNTYAVYSTNVYRDASAWYHIVCSVDTTQATNTNRVKLYVNGVQVTQNAGGSGYPLQNTNTSVNATVEHRHGGIATYGRYFDGYMAEVNFIDGQALTPSSFGETDTATGVWKPKKFSGTYGTNGFYLKFTDNSSLSALGTDSSGNGNTWTVNNISLTSGSTYDSMTDVPTNTNLNTANYCVMNPLIQTSNLNLSNGNLTITGTGTYSTSPATFGMSSGKWYWEYTCTTYSASGDTHYGIGTSAFNIYQNTWIGSTSAGWIYAASNGNKYNNNSAVAYGATFTSGDIIGVAFDADNGTLTFYKNGTTQGTAYTGLTSGPYFPVATVGTSNVTNANFGQRPFSYTPPTGFKALNTFNLPTPTIGATASSQAGKYFNAVLYTGTGSTPNSVTGVGFQPDFLWIKSRSNAYSHLLANAITTANNTLQSDSTAAEQTYGCINSFNSDGFTVDTDGTIGANNSGSTFVAWNWKANGTGSTNTAGSITSTVSANTTAGFSIVTWTGTGSTATVGHGLGVAPSMIIVKRRDAGGSGWSVYFTTLPAGYVLSLQSTNGEANSSNRFTTTLPTSTVFSIGTDSDLNASGGTYVAYCFAQVAGYSAFGSYTGNGSSDGTFVYTGFRPSFILVKRTDSTDNWVTFDNKRDPYNVSSNVLLPNLSNAESSSPSSASMDFVSNGFKIRASTGINSGTWIYMAFAENPFKYSLAR